MKLSIVSHSDALLSLFDLYTSLDYSDQEIDHHDKFALIQFNKLLTQCHKHFNYVLSYVSDFETIVKYSFEWCPFDINPIFFHEYLLSLGTILDDMEVYKSRQFSCIDYTGGLSIKVEI